MADLLDELGDISLDDAFAALDNPNPNAQQVTTPQTVTQTAAPVTPAEPFLKTSTGTVYKSAEDAVRGTEHKDALIAKLRQSEIDRTGIDPVTGQPVAKPTPVVNYAKDGERFLSDLKSAADKGDTKGYVDVQNKFVQDHMSPYAPVLVGLAKQQAMDTVSGTFADFKQFAGSDDYSTTLDENPMLKQAIQVSESDISQSGALGDFYRMAYRLNQARKLPEILAAQPQSTPAVARPTFTSGAPPVQSASGRQAAPSLNTPEGRKALMAQYEANGVADTRW